MKVPISIIPLFLLVGVACTFPWHPQMDGKVFQPIMGRSNERRICVELCMSGLGGEPCGEDCLDLAPLSLPIQSNTVGHVTKSKIEFVGKPRNDSCPVLCANNLGYPLCNCKYTNSIRTQVDYVQICGHFCVNYDYQIFGCQKCEIYKDVYKEASGTTTSNLKVSGSRRSVVPATSTVLTAFALDPFWTQWCVNKCSEGEGGSACNCDKPIMIAKN